jgi:hypothetical protein
MTIQTISSFAIFLPLLLSGAKFRTGDLKLRLFFVFLLIGTSVDFLGWMNFNTGIKIGFLIVVVLLYSFIEALFFTWIATAFLDKPGKLKARWFLGGLIVLLFIIRLFLIYRDSPNFVLSPIVESFYLVTTAFLTGFSLLRIAEKTEDLLKEPWFWILSGIFFYSFGTFFIDTLRGTTVLHFVWPVRNVINIIQYGFFVVGLLLIPASSES